MDRGGSIEREVGDPAAVHGVGEERRAAGLHDVPAAHDDHRAAIPHCFRPGIDDRAHIGGSEDVRQRADQRLHGRRALEHLAELGDRDLVAALGEGERRDRGEVGRWIA